MQKFVIALCLTLAIVSAQEACMQDVYSALPALQKMYMDYSNRNWAAIEGNIERFLPTGKLLLADCAGVMIPDSPRVQACVDNTKIFARLLVPLIVDSNNSTALFVLLEALPSLLNAFETQCINSQNTMTTVSSSPIRSNIRKVQIVNQNTVQDPLRCWSKVATITPTLKKFVIDVEAGANFDALRKDLEAIVTCVSDVCNSCGIPLPQEVTINPADEKVCIANARKLAASAKKLIFAQNNVFVILGEIREFLAEVMETLPSCGLEL